MDSSATKNLRQWADGPFPFIKTPKYKEGKTGYTDPYTETASTMCVVHNALLRGLNSIYLRGPNIQPADHKDFIGYSLCWHSAIHEHHSSEEEQFFPEIEAAVGEKGLLDTNVQQHKSFQAGLDEFSGYLEGLAGKESTFDATHLNNIIDSFATALCRQLASEIQSLQDLSKYGAKLPIGHLWDKEGKRTVVFPIPHLIFEIIPADTSHETTMTRFNALPFFFLNLDITHEDHLWKDWPPIPGPARWVITHCFTLWHPGYWKFASCDGNGRPKPLCAVALHGDLLLCWTSSYRFSTNSVHAGLWVETYESDNVGNPWDECLRKTLYSDLQTLTRLIC